MNDLSLFPSLAARLAKPERIRLAKARVPVALLADDAPVGAEWTGTVRLSSIF